MGSGHRGAGRHDTSAPLLAAGGENGEACLLDPATGQQAAEMRWDPGWSEGDPGSAIKICAVTADGRPLLATGHVTGVVRLWDPVTGHLAAVLRGHGSRVNAVCAVTITATAT